MQKCGTEADDKMAKEKHVVAGTTPIWKHLIDQLVETSLCSGFMSPAGHMPVYRNWKHDLRSGRGYFALDRCGLTVFDVHFFSFLHPFNNSKFDVIRTSVMCLVNLFHASYEFDISKQIQHYLCASTSSFRCSQHMTHSIIFSSSSSPAEIKFSRSRS